MQFTIATRAIMALIVLCLFSHCNKQDLPHGPYNAGCRITTLNDGFAEWTIAYNAKGNPVNRLREDRATGATDFFFRYDAKGRLTDLIESYGQGTANYGDAFESWHRFKYDNKNRIVFDSVYRFGRIGEHPLPDDIIPTSIFIETYAYDNRDRVIKVQTIVENAPDPSVSYYRYIYDNKHNLTHKALVVHRTSGETDSVIAATYGPYDNKVNLNRTHPIWQFLNRDYSVNNARTATSYNSKGLPTVFSGGKATTHFLAKEFSDVTITYVCK
jgi:hypothetical protein